MTTAREVWSLIAADPSAFVALLTELVIPRGLTS